MDLGIDLTGAGDGEATGPQSPSASGSTRTGVDDVDLAKAVAGMMSSTPTSTASLLLCFDSVEVQSLIKEPFSVRSFRRQVSLTPGLVTDPVSLHAASSSVVRSDFKRRTAEKPLSLVPLPLHFPQDDLISGESLLDGELESLRVEEVAAQSPLASVIDLVQAASVSQGGGPDVVDTTTTLDLEAIPEPVAVPLKRTLRARPPRDASRSSNDNGPHSDGKHVDGDSDYEQDKPKRGRTKKRESKSEFSKSAKQPKKEIAVVSSEDDVTVVEAASSGFRDPRSRFKRAKISTSATATSRADSAEAVDLTSVPTTPKRQTRQMLHAQAALQRVEIIVVKVPNDRNWGRLKLENVQGWLKVTNVGPESSFWSEQGVRVNDVIASLGSNPEIEDESMFDALVKSIVDYPVELTFRRGGTLSSRPAATTRALRRSNGNRRSTSAGSATMDDINDVIEIEARDADAGPSPEPKRISQPPVPKWSRAAEKIEGEIDLTKSDDEEDATAPAPQSSQWWLKGQIVKTPFGFGSVRKDVEKGHGPLSVWLQWDVRNAFFRGKERTSTFAPFVILNAQSSLGVEDASGIKALQFHLAPSEKMPSMPKGFSSTLSRADTARLWPGLHLNDTLIDTFLHRFFFASPTPIMTQPPPGSPEQPRPIKTHVFSTFFFPYVVSKKQADIAKWTKHVNLFDLDFIVMPINRGLHWSLTIICNPRLIRPRCENDPDPHDEEQAPVILKLDSTKGHKTQDISGSIRAWLLEEWMARNPTTPPAILTSGATNGVAVQHAPVVESSLSSPEPAAAQGPGESSVVAEDFIPAEENAGDISLASNAAVVREALLDAAPPPAGSVTPPMIETSRPSVRRKDLIVVAPRVPQQDNDCDCGVFVLVFAEKFFTELAPTFSCTWGMLRKSAVKIPKLDEKWFKGPDLVARKRMELIRFVDEASAATSEER